MVKEGYACWHLKCGQYFPTVKDLLDHRMTHTEVNNKGETIPCHLCQMYVTRQKKEGKYV